MNLIAKLLLAAIGIWVAFQLGAMLVKGATTSGITWRDDRMAYWSFALMRTAFVAFVAYALVSERV